MLGVCCLSERPWHSEQGGALKPLQSREISEEHGHASQPRLKRVDTGLEKVTGGFLPCDTHRFSHPAPSIWVLQNSGKKKIKIKTLKLAV